MWSLILFFFWLLVLGIQLAVKDNKWGLLIAMGILFGMAFLSSLAK